MQKLGNGRRREHDGHTNLPKTNRTSRESSEDSVDLLCILHLFSGEGATVFRLPDRDGDRRQSEVPLHGERFTPLFHISFRYGYERNSGTTRLVTVTSTGKHGSPVS